MSIFNVYERLPIFRLQEMIGERRLEEVQNTLSVLNYDPNSTHTKGFLANLARSQFDVRPLLRPDAAMELLNTLSELELQNILTGLGRSISGSSKSVLLSEVVKGLKTLEGRKVVAEYLGLGDYVSIDTSLVIAPSQISFERSQTPYKPLKDYQFEVYFQANDVLRNRLSRFILQMPTGSGKTRTAIEIICEYLNSYPNGTVIWLAHSTELCDQASDCFAEVWPHLAKRSLVFQRNYGSHKLAPIADQRLGFLCASFQSLLARVKRDPASVENYLGRDRLIVVDEAHRVVAPTYQKVTRSLFNNYSSVMGLTATPGRGTDYSGLNTSQENIELSNFFFEKQVSFNPAGDSPIEYLRKKHVLAEATFEPLFVSSSQLKLSKSELTYVSEMFELPPGFLKKLGKDHIRNAEILKRIVSLVKDRSFKSIIFFATSLEQSQLISTLLNFQGISAAHVDGKTPLALRKELIEKFRAQKIAVLCNYEVLSTGFDAPMVDCVFIARPTASVVLYSQMIGRGLRGEAIGGKSKCTIVNVKDNIRNLPSVDMMYQIFDEYWKKE